MLNSPSVRYFPLTILLGIILAIGTPLDARSSDAQGLTLLNAPVSGFDASVVYISTGLFIDEGNEWVETDLAGTVRFRFADRGRGEWSVVLYDQSRDVQLVLDLHNKQVLYAQGNEPLQPIYEITRVDSAANLQAAVSPVTHEPDIEIRVQNYSNQPLSLFIDTQPGEPTYVTDIDPLFEVTYPAKPAQVWRVAQGDTWLDAVELAAEDLTLRFPAPE